MKNKKKKTKICAKCGTENIFKSHLMSKNCTSCGEPLNWIRKVICNNCGKLNPINKKIPEDANCIHCYKPLLWTLKPETYTPNIIPFRQRIGSAVLAMVLFGASTYALKTRDIILPYGSKYHQYLVEYQNYGIILPVISMLLACAGFISIIADHFDKRNNEYRYEKFKDKTLWIGYILYFISLLFGHIYHE